MMQRENTMKVTAKSVEILGSPVGNMWDIFVDGKWYTRSTYHGNKLCHVRTLKVPEYIGAVSKAEVEQAIDKVYT
jgi:hypothetical protein